MTTHETLTQAEVSSRIDGFTKTLQRLAQKAHVDFILPEIQTLVKDILFLEHVAAQEPRLRETMLRLANRATALLEQTFNCRCTACSARRRKVEV